MTGQIEPMESVPDEKIVLQIKMPVPVSSLAAIVDALNKEHGKDLFMCEQPKGILIIFKP